MLAVNAETVCCESMLITCFASCLEMWDVIWEMRFRLSFAEVVWMIHSRDHVWSSHRQFFFWSSNLTFSEWRMLILDYQVTYVCSRFVEQRLWWDVKLDETSHQSWQKRLINLDESDLSNLISENVISSNLTKATHQTWWLKTSSYQIWRKRLIKLNESVISSNLWERRQSFYFLMSNLMQWHLMWKA